MRLFPSLILALAVSLPAQADEPPTVDDLAWMAGHWVMEGEQGRAEEIWMAPAGGVIVGSFRWVFPHGLVVTEYLLFEESEAGVTFRFKHFKPSFEPWEKEAANTYAVTEVAPGRVVLESTNWNGKVPQRIVYTRDGDELTFTGTNPSEGEDEEPMILVFRPMRP